MQIPTSPLTPRASVERRTNFVEYLSNNSPSNSIYRVLAAAPPIVGAACLRDLGSLTAWTGMSGLLIVFLFPPILCLASSAELRSRGVSPVTHYGTRFTSDTWIYTTLILGVLLSVYCSYCLVAMPPTEASESEE